MSSVSVSRLTFMSAASACAVRSCTRRLRHINPNEPSSRRNLIVLGSCESNEKEKKKRRKKRKTRNGFPPVKIKKGKGEEEPTRYSAETAAEVSGTVAVGDERGGDSDMSTSATRFSREMRLADLRLAVSSAVSASMASIRLAVSAPGLLVPPGLSASASASVLSLSTAGRMKETGSAANRANACSSSREPIIDLLTRRRPLLKAARWSASMARASPPAARASRALRISPDLLAVLEPSAVVPCSASPTARRFSLSYEEECR
jgi:hypothetical protein